MTNAMADQLDCELPVVEAILRGDHDAFAEFVRRQQSWVRGVVYGVLGDATRLDDVMQQVWSAVWHQLGTLKDPRCWRSWLYRLARNAATDAGRELSRHRRLQRSIRDSTLDCALPREISITEEQQQAVMEALYGLPALYREPFVLRHLEGWSYQQIAEVFNTPVDTVETRLVRARRHLREALKGKI